MVILVEHEYNKLGIDSLVYSYDTGGNQLTRVTDSAPTATHSQGFLDGNTTGNGYSYDLNGNMTQDKNKGITQITYNHLNLPQKIVGASQTIEYIYSANGQKLQKKVPNDEITRYSGNFIYEGTSLKQVLHGEGYIDMSGTATYHYYLKDHLGNNRMVVNQSGTVVQQTDYYPFGMTFNKSGSSDNKYLFSGKELQDDFELDIYDFHARGYDPTLGRTWQPDPMAEKFYSLSPYSMFANNPLRYIDPTGMEFTEASWEWVNKLIADVNRRQATNKVQIANRQAKIDVGGLSDRRANRLNRQIGRLENANASLETVRGEVATLAASDQVYNVSSISSSSATTTDAIGNSTITASTSFNTTTKAVDINISSNAGIRLFAHELKHAYQFDQGQMSLGSFGIKSPSYFLYDKQDEYGAFARQGLFGSTETTLPSRYNSLPTGPIDINNYNYNGRKLSQMNVYELQYLSKGVMKQAFRYKIDGVWRTFHH